MPHDRRPRHNYADLDKEREFPDQPAQGAPTIPSHWSVVAETRHERQEAGSTPTSLWGFDSVGKPLSHFQAKCQNRNLSIRYPSHETQSVALTHSWRSAQIDCLGR